VDALVPGITYALAIPSTLPLACTRIETPTLVASPDPVTPAQAPSPLRFKRLLLRSARRHGSAASEAQTSSLLVRA
jgi:hypothetical protein